MPLRSELLILIGRTHGLAAAADVYRALAAEPVNGEGKRIDWTLLEREIREGVRS